MPHPVTGLAISPHEVRSMLAAGDDRACRCRPHLVMHEPDPGPDLGPERDINTLVLRQHYPPCTHVRRVK